jgi:hypothetical protein
MEWEGFRIVRVSEDRRRGSKQPAVFRSRQPEMAGTDTTRRITYGAKQISGNPGLGYAS